MNKSNIVKFVLAMAFLGASTSLVWSDGNQSGQSTSDVQIPGVWQATRHGVNCQTGQDLPVSFPDIRTFHKDGTMTIFIGGFFVEVGVWQKGSGNTFSYRVRADNFDDNGVFISYQIATGTGQLTSANTFTATATVQVYDTDGNLLGTGCGRATGTRFQ